MPLSLSRVMVDWFKLIMNEISRAKAFVQSDQKNANKSSQFRKKSSQLTSKTLRYLINTSESKTHMNRHA